MTQKEIDKFLANTKVYVNGKSKEIQEKLFSLGYEWHGGDAVVDYTNEPFLYIDEDMSLTNDNDMTYFSNNENREITAEEILSLEITEPTYRPFKNKEECWNTMLNHEPFGWLKSIHAYYSVSSVDDVHVWLDHKAYFTFGETFNEFKFADGTPFGIKEE